MAEKENDYKKQLQANQKNYNTQLNEQRQHLAEYQNKFNALTQEKSKLNS